MKQPPGRPDRKRRPSAGRRTPPPDATGFERRYLERAINDQKPVVVRLRDGDVLHGVVVEDDRGHLLLERSDGPRVSLRKEEIRMIEESDD